LFLRRFAAVLISALFFPALPAQTAPASPPTVLFIGNSFPDWLARFFVRLTRGERLSSGTNNKMQYFADDHTRSDKNLILFLRSFGRAQLEIFNESGPLEFVNQLSEKWEARYPYEPPAPLVEPVTPADGEIKVETTRPVSLKAKVEAPIGLHIAAQGGCADASLYRRMRDAGLTIRSMFPGLMTLALW